jgi:dihydroorotate dehydrogenase (fumarate)
MDLTTTYLGLTLAHPFMPGASPLTDDLDTVLRLEDAGAGAIVLRSLFEEQIDQPALDGDPVLDRDVDCGSGPDDYLERLVRMKRRVAIPIIASLNGTTPHGWLKYAQMIEQAGADALELNVYYVATDWSESATAVEQRAVDLVAVLKESVRLPLAVKLSPFYSSLPHLAWKLSQLGADGLILFNRFYQPDIDPDALETTLALDLSSSSELRLRLRWLAILFGRVRMSLAATGGIHEALDAVKAVMAGADVVQIVSALLQRGPGHLAEIRTAFERWGDEHGYDTVAQMRGRMSLARCPDPGAFERGNYIRILHERHVAQALRMR